jgi:hypothetical protein
MRSTLGAGKVSLRKVGVGGGGDLVGCECDMVFGSKTQGGCMLARQNVETPSGHFSRIRGNQINEVQLLQIH